MTDEFIMEEDAIHLEDAEESKDEDIANLVPFIIDRYKRAEDFRYQEILLDQSVHHLLHHLVVA